jgi:hypothetical protein
MSIEPIDSPDVMPEEMEYGWTAVDRLSRLDDEEAREQDEAWEYFQHDLELTFNTPHGRRVAYYLLSRLGLFRTSMTGNSLTFFNEGKRDAALLIMDLIGNCCEAGKKLIYKILSLGNWELNASPKDKRTIPR